MINLFIHDSHLILDLDPPIGGSLALVAAMHPVLERWRGAGRLRWTRSATNFLHSSRQCTPGTGLPKKGVALVWYIVCSLFFRPKYAYFPICIIGFSTRLWSACIVGSLLNIVRTLSSVVAKSRQDAGAFSRKQHLTISTFLELAPRAPLSHLTDWDAEGVTYRQERQESHWSCPSSSGRTATAAESGTFSPNVACHHQGPLATGPARNHRFVAKVAVKECPALTVALHCLSLWLSCRLHCLLDR